MLAWGEPKAEHHWSLWLASQVRRCGSEAGSKGNLSWVGGVSASRANRWNSENSAGGEYNECTICRDGMVRTTTGKTSSSQKPFLPLELLGQLEDWCHQARQELGRGTSHGSCNHRCHQNWDEAGMEWDFSYPLPLSSLLNILSIDPTGNQKAKTPSMCSPEVRSQSRRWGRGLRKELAQEERMGRRNMMDDTQIS